MRQLLPKIAVPSNSLLMISTVELSDLLVDLYAAPLQPEKWQMFFDRLCLLTDISSGYLITVNPDDQNVVLAGGGTNFDPEVLHLYNDHYGANDPYRAPLTANPRLGVIQGEELVCQSVLVKSTLYNEVLSRYDMRYLTILSGTCTTQRADVFSFWRSSENGPMSDAGVRLLNMISPHVTTALQLHQQVAASYWVDVFSEATLDAMSIAAFIVTRKRLVQHMNQLAASYLQGTNGLSLHHQRLSLTNPTEDARLQFLIDGACGVRASSLSLPGGAMRIARSSLQIAVVPAPEEYGPADGGSCALVFVSDPSSPPRTRAALMRQIYGLTPAEARLADLLLEGLEVREIAERVGTTLETTRFRLKQVLAKTDTHRQAKLIRLLLSLPGQ